MYGSIVDIHFTTAANRRGKNMQTIAAKYNVRCPHLLRRATITKAAGQRSVPFIRRELSIKLCMLTHLHNDVRNDV